MVFGSDYKIGKLDYSSAMKVVVEKHYLHRASPCSFAFGLFHYDPEEYFPELVGVIVYGTPSSPTLRDGVCGKEYAEDVIELNRLWIDDSVPRNGESYFIANTIPLVDKDIVVSYADSGENHVGTIYQATNFMYTGLSSKGFNWYVEGLDQHNTSLLDRFNGEKDKIIAEYGDAFQLVPRTRKHRYVFFKGSKKRKKELMNAMKYKVLPYPKQYKNN